MTAGKPFQFLIYVSRSNVVLDDDILKEIAQKASTNNKSMGITGLLLRSGNHFVQILEGPSASVQELLDKIRRDKRHSDLRVIFNEPVDSRIFSKWSMNYYPLSGSFKSVLAESLGSDELGEIPPTISQDPLKVVQFIRGLPDFFIKSNIS